MAITSATSGEAAGVNASDHRAMVQRAGLPSIVEIAVVSVIGVAFTCAWALLAGKGVGWDQKNYQYYNVYAWLSGRMNDHIAPAGSHSWLNPLVYVPHYWFINHVRPAVAGALFGAWEGLNLPFVYALARMVLTRCSRRLSIGIAAICAAVGFSDPSLLSLMGTSESADNLVSMLVMGALILLCRMNNSADNEKETSRLCGAGLLLGAAAGLKWTCFVYALGMTLTLLVLWKLMRLSLRGFSFYAAGGVAGFLATGGYWSAILWRDYGNPFFPYWNRTFQSPWAVVSNFRDTRFLPGSIENAIAYPFDWFVGLHPTSEDAFRDARFAVLSVLIPIAIVATAAQWIARRLSKDSGESAAAALATVANRWLLLAFSVFSYIAWLKVFSIQRYLSPLTLLSGLLVILALDYLLARTEAKVAAFFLVACFSLAWMRVELSGWRVPYGDDWFGVQPVAEVQQPNTLFVMLGGGPMGYVVPFLPESARTVRLISSTIPDTETELVRHAREAITEHSGLMRSLSGSPLADADLAFLPRFGLALDATDCVQFRTETDHFTSCRLLRAAANAVPAQPAPTETHGR